jgi:hypothetical protein
MQLTCLIKMMEPGDLLDESYRNIIKSSGQRLWKMETGNLLNHGRACSSGINSNRQEPLKIEQGKLVNESYSNGIKIRRNQTLGREEQSDAGNYP